ncbi:hypothetical protein [Occultella aeris]|uniref:hypothetical protein n=1 Tax=Occultella aeris TaxID=2761496 RepID=UPI0012EAE4B0|nr:hypothetical protein [Occultella aeris]
MSETAVDQEWALPLLTFLTVVEGPLEADGRRQRRHPAARCPGWDTRQHVEPTVAG